MTFRILTIKLLTMVALVGLLLKRIISGVHTSAQIPIILLK